MLASSLASSHSNFYYASSGTDNAFITLVTYSIFIINKSLALQAWSPSFLLPITLEIFDSLPYKAREK